MSTLRSVSLRLSRRMPALRIPRRQAHGDDLSPEEASKDIRLWKVWSYGGVAFLVAFGLKLIFGGEHHNPEKKAYSHLEIRHKPWAWGDGNTSMFHAAFGKQHHGGGHEEHH